MKAIIFDMDGLMIDSEKLYFETDREVVREFGREVSDSTLVKRMGRKPLESMEVIIKDLGIDVTPEVMLEMREKRFEEKLRRYIVPMPGLFEILDAFKGRLKLAIATGSSRKFMDIVLERLEIRCFFDALQTAESIFNGKPDPEIYLRTAEQLSLRPQDCIVLEDSDNGALAGKNAGCYTIAIPSEFTFRQDFSFADYIAKDLNDAREHIEKII